jgi:hypothetical protein
MLQLRQLRILDFPNQSLIFLLSQLLLNDPHTCLYGLSLPEQVSVLALDGTVRCLRYSAWGWGCRQESTSALGQAGTESACIDVPVRKLTGPCR